MEGDQARVQSTPPARLEIAHVLFADIVGYSRLPMDEQTKALGRLQEVVRSTREFREAQSKDQLISLPTGDGMALVFFGSPEDPVECAVEIGRALQSNPNLKLRMGVHTGPVYRVSDINANRNVAGGGINTAQRVMDCGDAGHILVSKVTAEMLRELSGWASKLHDLGEAEVKHGVRMHVFNLVAAGAGNPEVPQKLRRAQAVAEESPAPPTPKAVHAAGRIRRRRLAFAASSAAVILALAALAYFYYLPEDPGINSMAVLPFVDAGADPDTEYLSDGITETLINSLSQLPNMRMIARTSAQRYQGRDVDPQTVARELGVQAVLMGRVARRGDSLSVSVELVDARDNSHIWGEQYNRSLSDILVVQQEIAREIAERLRARLTGEERRRVTRNYTENVEAYQLYLRGRHHWNRRTAEGLRQAIGYFQQAIDRDPNYALAYSGLADCYSLLQEFGGDPVGEVVPRARAAALRALEIDASLAEAHASLGLNYYQSWQWAESERELKRAIELNPNYASAHQWYALWLEFMGRSDEALGEIRRAQELDPLSPIINTNLARNYLMRGDLDAALNECRKVIELSPAFPNAHLILAHVYLKQGRHEEAIAEFPLP